MRWTIFAAMVVACGAAWADELPKDTNQLKALTVEQAEALAQRTGILGLNSLTALSDKAAEALREHPDIRLPERFQR